jgi:RNA recognition motif-containing protein
VKGLNEGTNNIR